MSDEVLGYRIVAVKACPFCVDGDVAAADEPEPIFCFKCDGTGSRLVDTGITVEPVPVVDDYDSACSAYSGPTAVEVTPNGTVLLWAEWDSATEDEGTDIGGLFREPPVVGSSVWREVSDA